MRIWSVGFVVLLGVGSAALAKTAPVKPLPPVHYTCEDGTRLRLTFSAPEVVPGTALLRLLGTGTELRLDRAPSADGGRYTGGQVEFWDKGETASFTRNGSTLSCRPTKR